MNRVNKLFSLHNKVIIVAGGAGQIGFSFSEILADAGAQVIIADIDEEMAMRKIRGIDLESYDGFIEFIKLDVSSKKGVAEFYSALQSHIKEPLYGLVNSFHFKGNTRKLDASSSFFADFEDYPEEAWDLVHDVNLKGSFLMSQMAVPLMRKGGVMVNISSTYGIGSANKSIYGNSGINSPVAYGTSKAALEVA